MACGAYVAQEGMGHPGRVPGAGLQFTQEEVAMEVPQLLQVAKEVGTLAAQALGQIGAIQLRKVVLDGIVEGTDILPLCSHHLCQHQLESNRWMESGPKTSILPLPSLPCPLPAPVGVPGVRVARWMHGGGRPWLDTTTSLWSGHKVAVVGRHLDTLPQVLIKAVCLPQGRSGSYSRNPADTQATCAACRWELQCGL